MIGIDDVFVDLESLFDHYGLDNITESSDQELSANCPFHDGDEGHHFGMNRESGLWNCWVCGVGGSIVQFAERMDGKGPTDARRVLSGLAMDDISTIDIKLKEELGRLMSGQRPGDEPSAYIPYHRELHPYLRNRGFSEDTAEAWGLGYSKPLGRVVIPARDESDKMRGYILRAPDEHTRPKYLYTEGKWKSAVLFGMLMCPDRTAPLVVVEGSLDAMWLWQMGLQAVAILGSNVSDRQTELVSGYRDVVLMMDGDQTGMKAAFGADGVGEKLMGMGVAVRCVRYPEGRKDPQELTSQEVTMMLSDTRSLASLRMKASELARWRGESLLKSS